MREYMRFWGLIARNLNMHDRPTAQTVKRINVIIFKITIRLPFHQIPTKPSLGLTISLSKA